MSHLDDPAWRGQIRRLHREAAEDGRHWREQRAEDTRLGRDNNELVRMGRIYLAVSEREGCMLYRLAREACAVYIVEFGSSYGVSTLYLGAAARDNGGRMYTTEVHPDKCRALRDTLARSGLEDTVTLLEGDARETLRELGPGIDFLFLDGWKSQYLPVLEMLRARLAPGAQVAADNVHHPAAADYLELVTSDRSFRTEFSRDMALSRHGP